MIYAPFTPPRDPDELLESALCARLDRLDVRSRKVFAGKLPGERRSKRRGQSVEFDDFRPYVPGDDLRHIDWNVMARLDRLMVKLFREDQDLSVHLVLDLSPSMLAGARGEEPAKAVYAARLMAALAYVGLVNNNRVTLTTFGTPGGVRRLAALRGRRGIERAVRFMLDELGAAGGGLAPAAGGVGGGGAGDGPGRVFASAMARVATMARERGVLVLISDMLFADGLEEGLGYLAAGGAGAAGFDAACLQVLCADERDPARAREAGLVGDLRLTDIETGRAAEVTVSPALIAAYRRRLEAHLSRVGRACAARGLRHSVISTQTPVHGVIDGALRDDGLVG